MRRNAPENGIRRRASRLSFQIARHVVEEGFCIIQDYEGQIESGVDDCQGPASESSAECTSRSMRKTGMMVTMGREAFWWRESRS